MKRVSFFFEITKSKLRHSQRTHTYTYTSMNTRTQTLLYEHLRRLNWQILEIDEVTTGVAVDENVDKPLNAQYR